MFSPIHSIIGVAAGSLLLLAAPSAHRTYGTAVKVGNGEARAYVQLDEKTNTPREIGIALSERALEGLPTSGSGHQGNHMMTHQYILDLPGDNMTPFRFVELNWNPAGHEPDGVYEFPHFDFHFYTISQAAHDSIVPSDPTFAAKADNLPAKEFIPQFNAMLAPPGAKPSQVAVPGMGVHWGDLRAPELQKVLGKPEAYKPFTATFLHGTWNGQVHFWEPMVTHAHIVKKKSTLDPSVRDELISIPQPQKYQTPGYYPSAYRITWDAESREYRIALTQLAWRQ